MDQGNAQFPGPGPGLDDLNNTDVEAPGGTQATHQATGTGRGTRTGQGKGMGNGPRVVSPRDRVRQGLNNVRSAGRNYLAQNDPNAMRADLEDRIRNYPIASMAIAVLGGYLLAKIVD